MTVINKQPRKAGKYAVTEMVDSVGTNEETYSFLNSTVQEQLQIFNTGNKTLVVNVGTQVNVNIAPFEFQTFNESFTQFKIKTLSGFSSFRMVSLDQVSLDETEIQNKLNSVTNGGGSLPIFQELAAGEVVKLLTGSTPTEPTTPTNTAPTISSSYTPVSINDTTALSIPFSVTDAEGGAIVATYTKDGAATTVNISTGANTWNVGVLAAGSHTLSIQVKDSSNAVSNTLTFNVTITATAPATPTLKGVNAADFTKAGAATNTKYITLPAAVMNEAAYTKVAYVYTGPIAGTGNFNIISSTNAVFWVSNGSFSGGHGTTYADAVGVTAAQNTWYHVAVTYDGTNLKYYIDGVLKLTKAATTPANQTDVRIGSYQGNYPWSGYIDGAWVYDHALTAQEIADHQAGTFKRTGLLGEYLFEDGTTATDTSGNGNNGTLGTGMQFANVSAV